jgi:hypothetical protein
MSAAAAAAASIAGKCLLTDGAVGTNHFAVGGSVDSNTTHSVLYILEGGLAAVAKPAYLISTARETSRW